MQIRTMKKPTNIKKKRKQGFRERMRSRGGRQALNRRRAKGRKRIAI